MQPRPTPRVATKAIVASAVFAASMLGGLAGAASGVGIGDTPPIAPTTTVLPGPIEEIAADVGAAVGITTTTAPPASTTTTTSTTTPPPTTTPTPESQNQAAPPPATSQAGGAAPTGVASQPKPGPAGAPTGGATEPSIPVPDAGASNSLAAAPADGLVSAPGSRPATRSVVLLDQPAGFLVLPAGGRTSSVVLDKLAGLGLSPAVVASILAPFPVAGPATYTDDWGALRVGPTLHTHEGTDIMAAAGTPIIASADGVVTGLAINDRMGGTSLRLTAGDGSFFVYGFLDRFAPALTEGKGVSSGDVLGFVGSASEGKAPHLHYEIHPSGGAAVNPVPYLDRWLADATIVATAVQAAPERATEALAARPRVGVTASTATDRNPPAADARVLGRIQVISSSAMLPLWLFALMIGAGVAWKRMTRRRRRRRLRAPQPGAAAMAPPAPPTRLPMPV